MIGFWVEQQLLPTGLRKLRPMREARQRNLIPKRKKKCLLIDFAC